MGRRPNPLILEYFERGPKLNDNSNRYPHTCKQCGENFPKGRIDSLTAHITKKCPAISDSERLRACLELHGIAHGRAGADRQHHLALAPARQNGRSMPSAALSQEWSALETLAEASRQVDLSENSRTASGSAVAASIHRPDLHDPMSLEETSENSSQHPNDDLAKVEPHPLAHADHPLLPPVELSPEERLQALLPIKDSSPDPSNLSVAAAAAARLNPSFLDPQLVNHDSSSLSPAADEQMQPQQAASTSLTTTEDSSQPWGEMTCMRTAPIKALPTDNPPIPALLNRGGIRMETGGPLFNGKSRHFRSKFTPARRQEVKEVRKLGACIRCRILRKLCSKGTPCDTCRKVLAPRVWMTGCVRSRLHEQLDLYSAGVQVVLSQNRINLHKDQLQLTDVGSVIELSHFPDSGKRIELATLVALLEPGQGQETDETAAGPLDHQVIMINQEKEDVPAKLEAYMRDALPLLIEREPSTFTRVTLETAMQQLADGEEALLRRAIELWGLVECIDRERQWTIVERPPDEGGPTRPIKEAQSANEVDIYTMICMQLNAAAERKANSTSASLLNLMDRLLADSKTKAGFKIYLASVIFLNCVEKSTWAFKAWEQDHLRPGWPLERDPGAFSQQGATLASLLKMLLGIRKALPQTARSQPDGKLVALDPDPAIVGYFQSLDLDYDTVQARQRGSSHFSPADSRSLELSFCSHLLLNTAP